MSNIDKAAQFIAGAWPGGQGIDRERSRELAERMEEAGLLAPVLPQPILYAPEAGDAMEWNWGDGDSIHQYVAVQKGTIYFGLEVSDDLKLQPSQARSIALCLLAAATHLEANNG